MKSRRWMGCAMLALAASVLIIGNEANSGKKSKDSLDAIIEALRKGDGKAANALAAKAAREEEALEHVMESLERKAPAPLRGSIEKVIRNMSKEAFTPAELKKNGKALTIMAYRIGAVAKVCQAAPPKVNKGKKTKDRWLTYTEGVFAGSQDLLKAIKTSAAQDAKTAAVRINSNCNSCHSIWRD